MKSDNQIGKTNDYFVEEVKSANPKIVMKEETKTY